MTDRLHAIRESELQQIANVLFERMKKHGQLTHQDSDVMRFLVDVAERPEVIDD